MTLAQEMTLLGQKAKEAARLLAKASPAAKNAALTRLAALLEEREAELRTANAQDLAAARARGLDAPRMDRLTLHPAVLADMRAACLHVAGLPDPVGAMDSQWQRPNGLLVGRMRVPLGVIAMIYEARPNVTIDAAILCLKAGSAVILRGGSEALQLTMDTGTAWFFSRSRQKLWNKGETSGNFIFVSRILSDCDDDTLIYVGTPKGPVCHTGHRTCFFTTLWEKPEEK